ncbi:hypothetical protein [Methyloceanibacter sp.]|uniref:hypothetical protein n=1 Tax=Methyloceanibacter sp. TaxID=1965321 RepID=UPI002C105452|nr:hypothetical protein [Methyloceanibacter sp.]HML93249.1 hypothetical protein [Methyloceanibacter sp.]
MKIKLDPHRLTLLRQTVDRLQQASDEAADQLGDYFDALRMAQAELSAAEANLNEATREGDQRSMAHYRAVVEAANAKVEDADRLYENTAEGAERAREELRVARANLSTATKCAERAASRGEITLPPIIDKKPSRSLNTRAVR